MLAATLARVAPFGERGLKLYKIVSIVEILPVAPFGERGLKFKICQHLKYAHCVAPFGERGLKYCGEPERTDRRACRSLRGAWIEITSIGTILLHPHESLPSGSVD